MTRPKFEAAWAASQRIFAPANQAAAVAQLIGGSVAKNINLTAPAGWTNTCAVRMSYILNQSGVPVPRIEGKTVSGADKRWYFFRVSDVIDFLTLRWGKPDMVLPFPVSGGEQVADKRGVILFEVNGWADARGHATLWNGRECYDHCYFDEPGTKYRTERASFWILR